MKGFVKDLKLNNRNEKKYHLGAFYFPSKIKAIPLPPAPRAASAESGWSAGPGPRSPARPPSEPSSPSARPRRDGTDGAPEPTAGSGGRGNKTRYLRVGPCRPKQDACCCSTRIKESKCSSFTLLKAFIW